MFINRLKKHWESYTEQKLSRQTFNRLLLSRNKTCLKKFLDKFQRPIRTETPSKLRNTNWLSRYNINRHCLKKKQINFFFTIIQIKLGNFKFSLMVKTV